MKPPQDVSRNTKKSQGFLSLTFVWKILERSTGIAAIIASIIAFQALQETQTQTRILQLTSQTESQAAFTERETSLLERQAPLVIKCPAMWNGNVDGVLTFNQNGSSDWSEFPPRTLSATRGHASIICTITNYGRVPALLTEIPIKYMRYEYNCDLYRNTKNHWAAYRHEKHVSILGIGAGNTYTLGFESRYQGYIQIEIPHSAIYEIPGENTPTMRSLLRFEKGFFAFLLQNRFESDKYQNCETYHGPLELPNLSAKVVL